MSLEVECTLCTKVLKLTRFKWPDISVCNYLYSSPSGTRPSRGLCMLTCQRTSECIPIVGIILDSMSEIVLSYMSLVKIIFQLSKLRLYQSAHFFYFSKKERYIVLNWCLDLLHFKSCLQIDIGTRDVEYWLTLQQGF